MAEGKVEAGTSYGERGIKRKKGEVPDAFKQPDLMWSNKKEWTHYQGDGAKPFNRDPSLRSNHLTPGPTSDIGSHISTRDLEGTNIQTISGLYMVHIYYIDVSTKEDGTRFMIYWMFRIREKKTEFYTN